jgi:spermidine synthase
MGATFPVIGSVCIADRRRTGRDAALIYGLNTLGGTVGVLAAGFFLIREFGSRYSLFLAGCISLVLAVVAIIAALGKSKFLKEQSEPFFLPDPNRGPITAGRSIAFQPWLIAMGAGVAGFCALAYELVWTRLLVLVLQNSVYAFSVILAGFLAGIGIGSLMVAPALHRKWPPLPLFGGLQILCGMACLVAPLVFYLPQRPGEVSYLSFLLTRPFFLVLIPMILSGSLVPLAVELIQRQGAGVGRALGSIYAANGLGSVLGALLAAFALIPVFGCRQTSLLLFGIQLCFGTVLLASGSKRMPVRLGTGMIGIAIGILGVALMPENLVQHRYTEAAASEQPVYFEEGRVATTSVTRNRSGNLILYLNGIPEVINDRPALRTFRLMALLPYLMHPDPRNALMITFGAGISAGLAVHLYPEVTCVELNESCRQVARIFERDNRHVLEADNLTLQIDDGRNFLLNTTERYGAIISDATHPHSYDSWILFTREFYRLCADRMDPGGVFCQWLPLHGLAPQQFRTILNTVQSVFPELTVWVVDGAYCLMLAGEHPLRLNPQRLAATINRIDLRPFLSPVGLDNPYAIMHGFVADRQGLKPLLENEVLINTDNQPYNQFFPLDVTGFGRLRWHVENLRQLMQCRQKHAFHIVPSGVANEPRS